MQVSGEADIFGRVTLTPNPMRYGLLLIFALLATACSTTSTDTESAPDVIILQMNDVYEISPLEGGKVGGLARVATLKAQLESEASVVSVLSGDFLSPSLIGTLKYQGSSIKGLQMVQTLNALGLDYVTFGNHEFDLKEHELLPRIDSSSFVWIGTNVLHVTEGDTLPFTQGGKPLPTSVVQTIDHEGGSLRILWIGECLPFNNKPYVTYAPYNTTAQAALKEHAGAYDLAIAMTHFDWKEDSLFAAENPQFALVLGGHNHEHGLMQVGDSRITKADANAKTVYVHRIWFREGKAPRITSTLVPITDAMEEEPKVAQVVSKWEQIAAEAMDQMGYDPNEVILQTDSVLDGRESSLRNHPTNLGQVTSLAMLWADTTLQLGIVNSGSIRLDDQLTGTITMYDILRTFPFGGGIVTASLTGAQLTEILAVGFHTNVGSGGYLHVAGVTELPSGEFALNGEPLVAHQTYKVAVSDFMASGGEANLEQLANYTWDHPDTWRGSVRNDIRDIVAAYFQAGGRW